MKLHGPAQGFRLQKVRVAAEYAGVALELTPDFKMGVCNRTPAFLAMNPLGKVPTLETSDGCLYESNAIARYVARAGPAAGLMGGSFLEQGQVDQWLDFCTNEVEFARAVWLYPLYGYLQFDAAAHAAAKEDMASACAVLDAHLATRTFLVGNRVTLADVIIGSTFVALYEKVFDASFRKPYVNLNRWFDTLVHQPQFAKVFGDVKLAKKEEKHADNKGGKNKGGGKKKKNKGNDEKKEAAPKKAKKEANPLTLLPKSSMSLDGVKKSFFLARPNFADWFPQFWDSMWDGAGYSIWSADYQYNDENKVFFMTANLCTGWNQRLESLRKWGFGAINILGKDDETGPFKINSVWLVRGTSMPEELTGCPDSEYHKFSPVDTTTEEGRKVFEQLMTADTVNGENVLERKYFK